MRKHVSLIPLAVLSVALLATACSDANEPLAPMRSGTSASNPLGGMTEWTGGVGSTVSSTLLPPIERTTPLAEDVTWSFDAGPLGATSSNAAVGLTIAIPAGALTSVQRVTITALAGDAVAYKFDPHGLVFERKVQLTQSIKGTTADEELLPALCGAYFATDRLELTADGLASVTELLSAVVDPFGRIVSFYIEHFSGYIVASGRTETEESPYP